MPQEIKNGLEIVPYMYDANTVEFCVKEVRTGRIIEDCCVSYTEAEMARDAYLDEMYAFTDGPFSAA